MKKIVWQFSIFKLRHASMRKIFDDSFLCSHDDLVRWYNVVPRKVNIHYLRTRLDRLPTHSNFGIRGIDLNSTRCPVCDNDIETALHFSVECSVAVDLWNSFSRWWDIGDFPKDIIGLITWSNSLALNNHT
ncbi:RNA-directed DNA polymerase, eukaryota, reverse transcriptase zinc-binding domain protein [Tanacetum coccineum]